MRVSVAVLLTLSLALAGQAQEAPCTVAASVETLDPASFPDAASAERALSSWRSVSRWIQSPGDRAAIELGFVIPPDVATVPLWTPVEGLPSGAFLALDRRRPVATVSAELDSSPRRIVFVVENGAKVSARARQVESDATAAILSAARPEDSFGFLTVGGPRVALPLGSSRESILRAGEGLARTQAGGPKGDGIPDALLEAAKLFGPGRDGDSIILFALKLSGKGRGRARSALTSRGIRLFCLGLGTMLEEAIGPGSWMNPLVTLSEDTGGAWEQVESLPRKGPATYASLRLVRTEAQTLYKMATAFYVLRLGRTGPHVMIYVSPQTLDQVPWARVIYAKPLPVCPPPPRHGARKG